MKVNIGKYPKRGNKAQRVKVKIHKYDTWNMDMTLAFVILPMLQQLKRTKHGSPYIDNADVPENLRLDDNSNQDDAYWRSFHARWDYVIDEMIFGFSQLVCGNDGIDYNDFQSEDYKKNQARLANSFMLFGKYYQSLWD